MSFQEINGSVRDIIYVSYRKASVGKVGNFGQGVNSDIHLQTVKIKMGRLIKSTRTF